jgi:hypothetical protein
MMQKTFKCGSFEFEIAIGMLAWPFIQTSRGQAILFWLLGAGWGSRIAWNKKGQLQRWDASGLKMEKPFRKWLVGKTQGDFEKELLKIRRKQVGAEILRARAYCKERIERYQEIYEEFPKNETSKKAFDRRCNFAKEEMSESIEGIRRVGISETKPSSLYIWDECPAMVFPPNIKSDWVEGIHEAIRIAEVLPGDKPAVTKKNKIMLEKIKANLKKAGLLKELK